MKNFGLALPTEFPLRGIENSIDLSTVIFCCAILSPALPRWTGIADARVIKLSGFPLSPIVCLVESAI